MPLILLRNGITDFMSNKTLDLRTGMQQWAAFNPPKHNNIVFHHNAFLCEKDIGVAASRIWQLEKRADRLYF